MKYWILIVCIALFVVGASAQDRTLEVEFRASYEKEPFLLKSEGHQFQEKQITFTRLRYYITNIELYLGETSVWKEKNSHHLINQEQIETTRIAFEIPKELTYDKIKYQLGVDSLTNVSGAMGGDLDPTKGMYWAWNSGYINFKLEGIYVDCPTRKNKFQFHIGGYAGNIASVQNIEHNIKKDKRLIVKVQVDQFLKGLDLREEHSLMSPSKKAVEFAESAALIFKIKDE